MKNVSLHNEAAADPRADADLRVALAAAIKGSASVRANFERHKAGISRVHEAITAGETALEKALKAVGAAQENHIVKSCIMWP